MIAEIIAKKSGSFLIHSVYQ